MKSLRAILLVLAVLLTSQPLAAQTATEGQRLAAESFQQAQEAFARREFAAAAAAFEQADRLAPHATPLLNAAEAWALANEPVHAAEMCERLLARPDVDPEHRAEAERRLATVGEKLARLDLVGEANLRVRIDAGPELALPTKRWVTPGTHALRVTNADGKERTTDVEVAAGDRKTVELALPDDKPPVTEPAPAPAPVPPPEPTGKDEGVPVATWICFGVAGAAAVVMAVFGGLTLKAQDDFDAQPTQGKADKFNRNKLITNVALGVAAAAAATGAIVWIVSATSSDEVAVGLSPTEGGAAAALRLRY